MFKRPFQSKSLSFPPLHPPTSKPPKPSRVSRSSRAHHPNHQRGFGLIEVVLSIAIVGVLLGIAIPVGRHYSRISRGSEAVVNLGRLFAGSRNYYERSIRTPLGKELKKRHFPSTAKSRQKEGDFAAKPAGMPCSLGSAQYPAASTTWNESDEPWRDLGFSIESAHFFRYLYASELSCTNSALVKGQACFHAQAQGDLDCNGVRSFYSLHGGFDQMSGDVVRGSILVHRRGE